MSLERGGFWKIFLPQQDLMADVYGVNPFSPVWICGMEFGGGCNTLDGLVKTGNSVKNSLTYPGWLTNDEAKSDEYSRISTAIVGCLTNSKLKAQFEDNLGSYVDLSQGVGQWSETNRIFCWGGHGFRMNAGVLSLSNHDAWHEDSKIWLSKDDSGDSMTLSEFTEYSDESGQIKNGINDYRVKMLKIFRNHVQERLNKYKPRLIICTGKKAFWEFKTLFLDEDEKQKPLNLSFSRQDNSEICIKGELYYHKASNTHVVLTNFITDRRPLYTIGLTDAASFANALLQMDELSWLHHLKTVPSLNNSGSEPNGYQLASYLDQLIRCSHDHFALVRSEGVQACVHRHESLANETLYKEIEAVRPQGDDIGDLMRQADDVALFNSLTSYAVSSGDFQIITELTDAIMIELKEERIRESNDMVQKQKVKRDILLNTSHLGCDSK